MRPWTNSTAAMLTVGWLTLVGGGFAVWEWHDRLPGEKTFVPIMVGEGSPNHRLKVLVFLHPHCPCGRATLAQLAKVQALSNPDVETTVEFVRPRGVPEGWERTDVWEQAAAIPYATVRCDVAGERARRSGAATSGQVLVFDSIGNTLFSGGITASRGQAGPSQGLRILLMVLGGLEPESRETSVFGCPLFDSIDCESEKGVACP